MKKILLIGMAALASAGAGAADFYVSLESGKNKNDGTKEAPLKNLWKALEKADTGDVIHLAAGNYPGKMKCGWFMLTKPVSIVGGYAPDFSTRDPLKYRTLFQPANEQNDKKGSGRGLLHMEFEKSPAKAPKGFKVKFDGLIFDEGFASSYHATKGKPEGFDTGMWLQGPAKNPADKCVSADRYLVYSASAGRAEGDLEIRNCAFINGSNMGLNLNWYKGEITVENCIFVNNRIIGANVNCSNPKPAVKWKFKNNTVLFTWTTKNDLLGMGYGVRANTKVESEFEDNVIGLNVLSGLDNTMGNPKDKKVEIDGNVFFLNRESDVQMTISPSIAKVRVDGFEDLEGTDGIKSIEDNVDLADPKAFEGRIDAKYLDAFLSMKCSEATKLDEGKCNALRSVLGLPLQGTIKTQCDMYANRYPWETALKLFGALPGKGAQDIK
ncbi:MAG: right-handed parallel beta-helix repeat-containing protein [Kiritimatiellia bacterium]